MRSRLSALVATVLLSAFASVPASRAAQAAPAAENTGKFPTIADVFTPGAFAARRAKLKPLVAGGLVVLFGEKNPIDAWEEHTNDPFFRVGPFRQEENLFYLTGLSFPDLAVIVDPSNGETDVYAPTGMAPGHADGGAGLRAAVARLGLTGPKPMSQLEDDLAVRIKGRTVYLLTRSDALETAFKPQHVFAPFLPGSAPNTYREDVVRALFEKRFPGATIKSIVPAMVTLRKVLDAEEIAAMRRVAKLSAAGVRRGMAHVRPGVDEREIAAEIEYSFKKSGAQLIAYGADLQSGPNGMRSFIDVDASYDLRNRTMRAGETALIDHSAELNYYVSDLARTVPVSGRFTPDQRLAYRVYREGVRGRARGDQAGEPVSGSRACRVARARSRAAETARLAPEARRRLRQGARRKHARPLPRHEPPHPRRLRIAARARAGRRLRIGVQDSRSRLALHHRGRRPRHAQRARGVHRRSAADAGGHRGDCDGRTGGQIEVLRFYVLRFYGAQILGFYGSRVLRF